MKCETSIDVHNKALSTGRRNLGRMSNKWLEEYRIWTTQWSTDPIRDEEEDDDDDEYISSIV
jgi:hypothetical protein